MKAMVLGATGFIGSHIVRQLIKEGIDVKVLRRPTSPALALEGLNVEYASGDLNDRSSIDKALKGCDALFHTAGYYPLYSLNLKQEVKCAAFQIKNVLDAAMNSDIKRMIFTSSPTTIGKSKTGPSDETTPYTFQHSKSAYVQAKYIQEQLVFKAVQKGLDAVVIAPMGVFGDYDIKPTSGRLVVMIAKGKMPVYINGAINVIDVDDVAYGHVSALKCGKSGEKYILGNLNTETKQLMHIIAGIANVKAPKINIPISIGYIFAAASEVIGKLTKQKWPLLPIVGVDLIKYGLHVNSSKAIEQLNLPQTPLEHTFEKALFWFKKHDYI